jgi:4-diphosphocytidyl-2-C-methyl-D-erythritol kinase
VTPPFQIRAAEAYRKLRLDLTAPFMGVKFKRCRQAGEFFDLISGMENDLEKALRESYPILDKIGEELLKVGADIVRLSGSGPTIFALFEDPALTEKSLRQIFKGEGWGLYVAGPLVLPAKMS